MKKLIPVALVCLATACSGGNNENEEADAGGEDMAMTEPDMGSDTATPGMDMSENNDNNDEPDMDREPPTCGPFDAVAEYVFANDEGAVYYADDAAEFPADSLAIEIYEAPATGTFTLGENYETCVHCVLIYADCQDFETCDRVLLATSGTLELTEVGGNGGQFTGSLSDVQFEEVTIDDETFLSTPVPGGELRCVDSFAFDAFNGTFCEMEGDVCEVGRAVDDPSFVCVDDGSGTGTGTCEAAAQLPSICGNTSFTGQISGAGTHDGGVYTNTDYTNDAGLQAVYDAIPAEAETVTDLSGAPLAVTGASVTATTFEGLANSQFWVQDANVALQVRLTDANGDPTPVGMDVKVGQAVSFTVTEVETFDGHPQIKTITDFAIDSEGNDVFVMEKFDADVAAADYGKLVRVGGTLGAGSACGGSSMCYDVTHGAADDKTVVLRSSSMFLDEDECAVFVGPVSGFPGPKDPGGVMTPQIDTLNFNWLFVATP